MRCWHIVRNTGIRRRYADVWVWRRSGIANQGIGRVLRHRRDRNVARVVTGGRYDCAERVVIDSEAEIGIENSLMDKIIQNAVARIQRWRDGRVWD